MPLIPLHQDSEVVMALGLEHAERNGHHYAFGLSHLTKKEKLSAVVKMPTLYQTRDNEVFMIIEEGRLPFYSSGPGFGSLVQPDWDALTPLKAWRGKEGA
jgi:hypothetical protein